MFQRYAPFIGLCLLAAISGWYFTDLAWESKWSERDKSDALSIVAAQEAERAKERQWQTDIQMVHDDAKKRQETIAADTAELSDAANRLRDKIKSMSAGQSGGNSTIADVSRSAATDKIVLGQLLEWSVGTNEALARYADQNREAALTCVAAYNALR